MHSENLTIFSPQNFVDYVGQPRAKKIASVIVQASKLQRKPLPNLLITGGYGLGKTSLAQVIRKEAGETVRIIDAASLNKELIPLSRGIIIDEIHNLDPQTADSLNILIDQGKTSIIGCTTNPGAISSAFKSRFRTIELDRYTVEDIKLIITHISVRKMIDINGKTVTDIALRSRLNPRVAINNLSFIFDYMTVNGALSVSPRLAQEAFDTLGIDPKGFTQRDHEYMAILSDKPLGISNIASRLGIDSQTIEKEIEPYLLQIGYIDRMNRGRVKIKEL